MERKYKCKYCNKKITANGSMCSRCKTKWVLIRKLLLMVKDESENQRGTRIMNCLHCGTPFKARNNRHCYCSASCKRDANFERKQATIRLNVKPANITIEDMVDEMMRLSEEKGRTVQYGELQKMLLTGRHVIGGKRNG